MFEGNQQKNPQTQPPAADQQMPGQNTPVGAPKHVYTMPEKFLQPRKAAAASGKSKKWLIIGGICTAVVLILIAIIVYAFEVSSQNAANVTPQNTNTLANANNSNTNGVRNRNANTNSGTALNFNINQSIENNVNAGLFPNGNSNANSNTNGPITLPDHSNVSDGRDKDRDGLTDIEEDIYKTRFDQPDTDKDGFVDGTEVKNLFSPTKAGETLLQSGLVIAYTQKEFGWTIDYPADWIAEPVDASKTEVMFTSDSVAGEFVEVLVTPNTTHQTAAQWYASLYEGVKPADLQAVTLGGLQGIVSADGFAYYVADDNYIIGIIYNFGTKTQVQFRTTFKMMAASFDYTAVPPAATNSNTNANTNASQSNANGNTNTANRNVNSSNTNS